MARPQLEASKNARDPPIRRQLQLKVGQGHRLESQVEGRCGTVTVA
ncbi:MAG: hypothetical protein GY696_23485 [Gammaproteobacteria bacterium]|nr:hypothetical protein [Gammaproteobacteria bacterium]